MERTCSQDALAASSTVEPSTPSLSPLYSFPPRPSDEGTGKDGRRAARAQTTESLSSVAKSAKESNSKSVNLFKRLQPKRSSFSILFLTEEIGVTALQRLSCLLATS